jgi:hypothetical protein
MSNRIIRAQVFHYTGDSPGNLEDRIVSKEVYLTKDDLETIASVLADDGDCEPILKKIRRLLK